MEQNPYETPPAAGAESRAGLSARPQRPIGVWIAVIWSALFAGLLPAVGTLLFYFAVPGGQIMGIARLVLGVALGVGVIAAAIGTFRGNSMARYVLAALVVIHYGLLAYNNFELAQEGVEVSGGTTRLIGRAVRSIITAAIIAGYLTLSRKARGFFQQHTGGR
jgi:hypothetical protein